jgi:hypothetical protein
MRIVTNELRIKRGRQSGTIMFFVSLFVLTGGLIFTNFLALSTEALLFVPLLVMPIGLITTVTSVRLTNHWVRQPRPEDALKLSLVGINRRSVLYNYFPTAPHMLVTPHGVFSITTRFQMTRFKVEGETWTNYKLSGPLAPFFLYMKQEGLGKPFEDARADAAKAQAIIDDALPGHGVQVEPIVVFIHPKAEVEIIAPALPVAYASTKKRPSLKAVLRDDKRDKQRDSDSGEILDDADLRIIDNALVATLSDKERAEAIIEED